MHFSSYPSVESVNVIISYSSNPISSPNFLVITFVGYMWTLFSSISFQFAIGALSLIAPTPSFLPQEMLLKRAADLVEALYGTPHNNQVRYVCLTLCCSVAFDF